MQKWRVVEFNSDCSLGQIQRDLLVSVRPELVEGYVSTVQVVRQAQGERPNGLSGFKGGLIAYIFSRCDLQGGITAWVHAGLPVRV